MKHCEPSSRRNDKTRSRPDFPLHFDGGIAMFDFVDFILGLVSDILLALVPTSGKTVTGISSSLVSPFWPAHFVLFLPKRLYRHDPKSLGMRTCTPLRLKNCSGGHSDAAANEQPPERVPSGRSRTTRRSRMAGALHLSAAARRRGTLALCQGAKPLEERSRSDAGATPARRLTCFAPASLREQTRASFRAGELLFCRLECGIMRQHPPNTPFQPTASRARSSAFWWGRQRACGG